MNTQKLYDLKEMLCHELDNIAGKGELSAGDLEAAHKLTDTIKNVDKIMMLEDGYSWDGEWSADMRGTYGRSYRTRDSRGRYSGTYPRYYRDSIKDKLAELMDEAGTDRERETIKRCMERLE